MDKISSNKRKINDASRQRAARVPGSLAEVFDWVRQHLAAHGTPEDLSSETFGARLKYLWKWSSVTAEQLSEALDVTPPTFRAWIAGRSSPGVETLAKLEEITGVSVQWLVTGRPPMVLHTDGNKLPAVRGQVEGFVYVPRYDVRAGAGAGQVVESENLRGFVAFREDWVRTRLRRNPVHLKVIEAFGDSMSPTISDGDIMLVDTSEDRVRGAAIYIVLAGNEVIVKRVELKIDGTLEVKSDNPAYEPITLRGHQIAELRVIGKVVWSGGLV